MSQIKVAVIVGSLRKESINKKLALAVSGMFADRFELQRVDISDLPLYNQDFDADFPASGVRFKQQVEAADALLFVTSEYNRSIPGVLKNAIDLGSRPSGSNSFAGKPAAIIGTSPGARATAPAQRTGWTGCVGHGPARSHGAVPGRPDRCGRTHRQRAHAEIPAAFRGRLFHLVDQNPGCVITPTCCSGYGRSAP